MLCNTIQQYKGIKLLTYTMTWIYLLRSVLSEKGQSQKAMY